MCWNCTRRLAQTDLPDTVWLQCYSSKHFSKVECKKQNGCKPHFKNAWDLSLKSCKHPTEGWMLPLFLHFHNIFWSSFFMSFSKTGTACRATWKFIRWLYTVHSRSFRQISSSYVLLTYALITNHGSFKNSLNVSPALDQRFCLVDAFLSTALDTEFVKCCIISPIFLNPWTKLSKMLWFLGKHFNSSVQKRSLDFFAIHTKILQSSSSS